MKYKIGDLVKIKPFEWWGKLIKDNEGDGVMYDSMGDSIYFLKEAAITHCGTIGEITFRDEEDSKYTYLINGYGYFNERWIERKVRKINIPLKLMKREL